MLAAGFGLVHGLGFYGALRDLGLGQANVVTTLLAFNLGVEAGQLAVISFLYGPLIWWANKPWYSKSNRFCSAMILLVASWWVIQRIFLG